MPPELGYLFIDTTHTETNLIQHEHDPFGLDGSGRDSVGFSPFGAKDAVETE